MSNFKNTSRYRNATIAKNRSNKNFLILRSNVDIEPGDGDRFITITDEIIKRPDIISFKAYGISDYWWVIYEFNGIKDPFFDLKLNDNLRIPPIDKVITAVAALES